MKPERCTHIIGTLIAIILLAIGSLLLAVSGATATHAGMSHTCYASSCTGESPVDTGCFRDARTVTTAYDDDYGISDEHGQRQVAVYLKLRYSPTCRAVWVQAFSNEAHPHLLAFVEGSGRPQQNTLIDSPSSSSWRFYSYSTMMNDKNLEARACADYGEAGLTCTDWF